MADLRKDGQEALALELLRHAVHENAFSYAEVTPLLQKLLPRAAEPAHSLYALMHLLQRRGDAEASALAQRIHTGIVHKAALAAQTRRTTPEYAWRTLPELAHLPPDLPIGWRDEDQTLAILRQTAAVERDRAFLLATTPDMTTPLRAIAEACIRQQEQFQRQTTRWLLLPPALLWSGFSPPPGCALPTGATNDPQAEESARLADLARMAATAADDAGAPEALQRLVAWPDAVAAPFILQACMAAPALQPYAMHALALRTGIQSVHWEEWEDWLRRAGAASIELRAAAARLAEEYCDELRLLWLREQPCTPDPVLEATLAAAMAASARQGIQSSGFVHRWESSLTPAEVIRLGGSLATPPPLPQAVAQIVPAPALQEPSVVAANPLPTERAPARTIVDVRRPAPAPRPPPEPTVWDSHIQPFLAANWYIIAGLLMVVAGASLLAYFTWDKSVFVRYLFLPVLLAAFTGGMAELGLRLFRRHADLRVTGTFLLGGAVCLLPVNFMVLCRAGEDPRAAGLVLPALGLYAALTGFGLWRWCGVMRRELRLLLGAPLLAVNLLAVLGDMPGIREAAADHRAALVPVTITAAVLLLLAVSNRFLQTVLTRELLAAKLVPWFFGITMAATTVQVAAWRHFHLHITPQPQDYALAAILAGATLLRWERRACELRATGATYGGESFLGYAALLLGILMAAGSEGLRLAALLLAGVIWLVQAPRRPGVVHYWIGATLCLLGGASIGLLHAFPCSRELNLLPALGLSLAFAVGAVRALSGRLGETRLRQVALEIQPPLLLLTAIVAVLSQFHLRSAPWQTGVTLLAVAAFFAVRATRADRRDWLAIAAAGAGLCLPYLGCADMRQYRFDGNTLAIGFGLLATAWLTVARLVPVAVWRTNGNGLATCFGGAGMFGLCLRLFLANGPAMTGADLAGGALLAATLGVTAWQARAQLPGLLAAILLAFILPFFQMPDGVMPAWLYDGSGLTSAVAALVLTLGCFALRRAEIRRGIQNLFSVPVLIAVVWLSTKALILQIQRHPDQTPFLVSSICLAMTGYAAAIYARQTPAGKFLFHASWLLLGAGIVMGCDAAGCNGMAMFQYPLLWTGVALTVLLAAEAAVARRLDWVVEFFVHPRLVFLARASAVVAALLTVIIQSPFHDNRSRTHWLALFLAAQLAWHGLRTSRRRFGAVLFALAASWLCAGRDLPASFGGVPILLLTVLLVDAVLEFLPKTRAGLHLLRAPFVAGSTLLAPVLALVVFFSVHPVDGGMLSFTPQSATVCLLFASLLLVARTQACAGFALPAAALGYLLCLLPCHAEELCRPWRLSAFALLLCLLPFLARLLAVRGPRLLRGVAPQLPEWAATSQAPWFLGPGLMLAVSAAFLQVAMTVAGHADDARGVQVLTPFATVLALALAGGYWRQGTLWCIAECLLPLANVFAVAVLWGRDLLDLQLMPVHVVGIAAVLTIAEFAAVRWLALRFEAPSRFTTARRLHYGCAVLAGLTLVLLGMNYISNPDLARIPAMRFAVSGVLAFCAGTYFRFAARRPEHLRAQAGVWMESLWHVALGLTLWCGALLIPALRTPQAALYALALPAAACWIAAEWFLNIRQTTEANILTGERFRTSAAAFATLILVLYVFRLPFQMVLFPATPLNLHVYHTGAAAALLMGLILIRVRGLGGAPWTALSGGLALMTGFYFLATWFPGLSPFAFPMAAAWAAVGAAHLLILLSYQQSPLRNLIQHAGGIGAEEWHAHRRQWGAFLTVAAHVAVVAGLVQGFAAHSREATPLLVALASVLIHQAAIGAPWARMYWGVAVLEILLALHLDFLLPESAPGLIPARQVVWFLLVPWLGVAVWWRRVRGWMAPVVLWLGAGRLALICAGHLLYHGPATGSGLLIAAAMTDNGLLTPLAEDAPRARTLAKLMLATPLWLAYFGTRWFTGDNPAGFRPLLGSIAALLGTGMLARLAESTTGPTATLTTLRRLAHEVVAFCRRDGAAVARTLLACAFAGLVLLTFLHDDARHGALGRMLVLAFVWGISCAAWLREGYLRDGALPYTLSVLSLAGVWILLRRLLFLHFSFWTYEYDIWLSLGASIAFSSAKRLVQHKQPGLSRTMTGAVWLLPLLQCSWLLTNHLSADLALLVIGVQAMLFAWHGGGKRDSPYNAISMLGFVGFVCLLFWARLDLRCVQAYTIPVGLGVLGLVWLFGEHLPPTLRNAVRLVTVLAMLGSCGYYALLDNRYPVGFHLTMILLCLAVMALGPLLRVQLYLYFGFAGFATDLVALVVKQFQAFDRSVQMMGIGALLLLLGMAIVGGAILYKTRRDAILAFAARVRARLGAWE
jgi:hypothetical protein